MKNFFLLWLFLLSLPSICFADYNLSGPQSICPNTTVTYRFGNNDTKNTSYSIDISQEGVIVEYQAESGNPVSVAPSTNTRSISFPDTPNQTVSGGNGCYVTVLWGNFRGSTATIYGSSYVPTYVPWREPVQAASLSVQIGSPDITGTTLFEPTNSTCDHKILSFSIPVVAGANSYNWQNSLGWRLATTMINGGYSYATFDSSISSITSGQVTVTAVNNGCPSSSSTKTFLVSRGPGTHAIEGPDDVPSGSYTKFYAPAGCTNYQWSVTGNLSIMEGQGSDQVKVYVPNPGIISVTYTDICGQNQISDREVHSSGPAEPGVPSTQDRQSGSSTNTEDKPIAKSVAKELAIYPNPVANELSVSSIGEDKIMIYNSRGVLVNESNIAIESVRTLINTRALSSGTYYVRLFKEGKLLSEKQVLIQH